MKNLSHFSNFFVVNNRDNFIFYYIKKMKKFWLLTTLLIGGLLLTGCNKTVENPEIIENDCYVDGSCLVEVNEPTIEEDGLSEIENLKQSFEWDIIDWTNAETVEITQDDTLYFNDKFWFAVILWKEWNWWKIEAKTHNEQFWENAISRTIQFYQKWFDYESYKLSIDKNDRYDSMKKHDEFWTEEDFEKSTKWRNNKYYFLGGIGGFISPSMDTSEELDTNLFPNWFIFYDIN